MASRTPEDRRADAATRTSVKRTLDYKWVVLINTTVGMFMGSMDNSIMTISLPDVMRSINATVVEVMWIVMGYALFQTALLLPLARLGDMKGRVKLYNLGFLLFTISSALCGFAQTGTQLLIFRLLQGASSALIFSSSSALLTDAFPGRQRGMALGINTMAAVSGIVVGTVVGGVITEYFGWRYIFLVNLPFGAFTTAWAYLKLRETGRLDRDARFDIGGMVTFPLAVAGILSALTFVVLGHWGELATNAMFAGGVAMLFVFWFIEQRVSAPMMDLALFRIRIFWAGNASFLLSALARGATTFILSWYFQAGLQLSPKDAGVRLIPLALSTAISAPIAGRMSDRIGSRVLSSLGLAVGTAAMLGLSVLLGQTDPNYPIMAFLFVVMGSGNAFFNTPNTNSVMSSVPPNRRGVAAGTRNLLLATGQTTSIAFTMAIVATTMSYTSLVRLFSNAGESEAGIDVSAFITGLREVFVVCAIISMVALAMSVMRGKSADLQQISAAPEAKAALA